MTINNPASFCASLWDWGCLDGCFGESKIKTSDIDGIIEHHGYFLVLESKLPNVNIPQGQEILLRQLGRIPYGLFTVFVIWGFPQHPERLRLITSTVDYTENADLERLRYRVNRWYEWAEKREPFNGNGATP